MRRLAASIASTWRRSPTVRFLARTAAAGAAGYAVEALRNGDALTLSGAGAAAGVAFLVALSGLLTPLEPFVGVNKATVEVPTPPAAPVPPD